MGAFQKVKHFLGEISFLHWALGGGAIVITTILGWGLPLWALFILALFSMVLVLAGANLWTRLSGDTPRKENFKQQLTEALDLDERLTQLESQKQTAREITRDQEAILIEALQNHKRQIFILYHQSALDAPSYANQLTTAFEKSGWEVICRATFVGHELKYKEGLWIVGEQSMGTTLQNIFQNADIAITLSKEDVEADLAIIVGKQGSDLLTDSGGKAITGGVGEKETTEIIFQKRVDPFVQPIGDNCLLFRVAVKSTVEVTGVSLVISEVEPRPLTPSGSLFSGTEISLIQRHDRKHFNSGDRYKERFDLHPDQPVYIDVAQKESSVPCIDIRHAMEGDVDNLIEPGKYTITLETRGPVLVSKRFTLVARDAGFLDFEPLDS